MDTQEQNTPVEHLSGPYKVQVLDRAIALLEILALSSTEMSLSELTAAVGLHKSTVHRLLMVLEGHRLVDKSPLHGHYRLGLKLFELSGASISHLNLREHIRPHLEWLTQQTGETVYLSQLNHGEVLCLDFTEPPRALRIFRRIGSRYSIHCTAAGKAMASLLPDDAVRAIVRQHGLIPSTPKSIVTEEEFFAEVALTRQRGYAFSEEESEEGIRSVAAAFRLSDGVSLVAISVSGPVSRFTVEKRMAALVDLRSVVEEATRTLGRIATGHSPDADEGRSRRGY